MSEVSDWVSEIDYHRQRVDCALPLNVIVLLEGFMGQRLAEKI